MHLFQENHQSSGSQTVKLSPDRIEKTDLFSLWNSLYSSQIITTNLANISRHWFGWALDGPMSDCSQRTNR